MSLKPGQMFRGKELIIASSPGMLVVMRDGKRTCLYPMSIIGQDAVVQVKWHTASALKNALHFGYELVAEP